MLCCIHKGHTHVQYGSIQAMGITNAIFKMVEDTNNQKKGELLEWKCFVLVLLTLTYGEYHHYPRVYKLL